MDGCDAVISSFPSLSKRQIRRILQGESRRFEVTKSLLNLLYNIVTVGSVAVSDGQRAYFDKNTELVWLLLSSSISLARKKASLEENISLVVNIAASCPRKGV